MYDRLISVVIPSYKREASLMKRSVLSVLGQTYKNVEIIVVDDNPNDSELCVDIKRFCDQFGQVHYVKLDGNQGACAARNLGIEKSKGEWIGFLDDDDEWLPQKLEKSIPHFRDNIGIVASPGYILVEDDSGNVVEKKDYHYNDTNKERIVHEDFLAKDLIGSTSQAIVRKKCFAVCGGFDVSLPARQDYEMWIRISQKYDVYYVNEKLFHHYMHTGEQISTNPHKSIVGFNTILKKYSDEFKRHPAAYVRMNIRIYKEARRANERKVMAGAIGRCIFHPVVMAKYFLGK